MKTKICTTCGADKLTSEFHKEKNVKSGLRGYCKVCRKNYDSLFNRKYPWRIVLKSIKQRCNNKNNKRYNRYGGRGIKCLITVEELEKLWFRDEAYFMKKPTIDREENDGNYSYSNCRYIEHKENSIKDHRKPTLQYDLDGNFIKEWSSGIEACTLLKIKTSNMSNCCTGKRKTAGGFKWKFKEK